MATFILFVLFLLCRAAAAMAESAEDKAALLSFLALVPHEPRLRWNTSASACTWVGVRCDAAGVRVVSLRLPGVGLAGRVPPATVGRLTALRALSLRSNRLAGEIPADLANLTRLRGLYLQNNVFSGGFPAAALLGLRRLARLDLSGNRLGGEIPVAINNLPDLALLFLQGNNFSGELPSIGTPSLISFDVSDNDLRGPIPGSLSRFPASAFAGNLRLCGPPLSALCGPSLSSPPPPPPPDTNPIQTPTRRQRSLRRATVIAITIAATTSAVIILLLMLICCLRRRRRRQPGKGAVEAGTTSSSKDHSGVVGVGAAAGGNKLVFMEGGGCSFDLEDLLRASAEVLGKGGAGTTYKAVLEEGTTVVVKRLKEVAVGRREFEQQMEAVGRVKHPNVVPLRAFYFSKDEKLLVSDFMAAGSLSALLHGSRGSGRTPLDWDTRVRIAAAAGRGIAHLHATAGAPHGNIKASNVLLRPDLDAAVSDFGLAPLFSPAGHPRTEAGYRAPEVSGTGRPTVKSDVYSYGVLLLELLTGKSPAAAAAGEGEGVDLPRWVTSVVREEWTAEVFDAELVKYQADIEEEEMMQLLQVAMTCVAASPDLRPEFSDVVRSVEDLARSDDYADGGGSPSASRTP